MDRVLKYKLFELKENIVGNKETSEVEIFEITNASTFVYSVIVSIDDTEFDIRVSIDDIFEHIASENDTKWIKRDGVRTNCIVEVDDITEEVVYIPIHIYFEENKYDLLKKLITKNLM